MVELISDVTESFKGGLAVCGSILFIMEMVLMFLPKQPSATEKAITAAAETITKKMDAIHNA